MKLSIIIPSYHEDHRLLDLIASLAQFRRAGHEVIVVNGDPNDHTVNAVASDVDFIITSDKGRARQMNAGAQHASGDSYWFLHVDTVLVHPVDQYLSLLLSLKPEQWGRFNIQFDSDRIIFKIIAFMMNVRSKLTGIATGDQGIFTHRQAFQAVQGYTEIALMEDIDACRKLKRVSCPIISRLLIQTSTRRWYQHGIIRTILLMWWLRLRFFLGADPHTLAKQYD
jgi:rSAM/selenodomain-associated transferase 2